MKHLFFALMVLMAAVSCDQLGNVGVKPDYEKEVEISFSYVLSANEGNDMTKVTDSEIFGQFYKKISDGTLIAPSFELTLTEQKTGDEYILKGEWEENETYTVVCGTYKVKGFATAEGDHIQKTCSIVFDEEVTIDESTSSIRLSAGYDAALIVFNDSQVKTLTNYDGNDETTDFFKFENYFYAFVNGSLYDSGKADKAYIQGTTDEGKDFRLWSAETRYEKGKYYVYTDLLTDEGALEGDFTLDFDIPEMEDGESGGNVSDMTINKGWNVEFTGTIEVEGEIYDNTVSVSSSDDNTYFITAVYREDYEGMDIAELASQELEYLIEWIEYIEEYMQLGLTLSDFLYAGNAFEAFDLYSGEYYGLAIGVTGGGELTGLYAVSDLIVIEEEEMDSEYSDWIGDWTWTGSNGVSFEVSFVEDAVNQSYLMYGWEGDYSSDLAIPVEWIPDEGIWAIYPTDFGYFEFEGGEQASIILMAEDAEQYVYDDPYEPICYGGFYEDGTRGCVSNELTIDEETSVTFNTMLYIAEFTDGLYLISDIEDWPTFPITITPAEGTKSAARVSRKNQRIYTRFPKTIKLSYPVRKAAARRS